MTADEQLRARELAARMLGLPLEAIEHAAFKDGKLVVQPVATLTHFECDATVEGGATVTADELAAVVLDQAEREGIDRGAVLRSVADAIQRRWGPRYYVVDLGMDAGEVGEPDIYADPAVLR